MVAGKKLKALRQERERRKARILKEIKHTRDRIKAHKEQGGISMIDLVDVEMLEHLIEMHDKVPRVLVSIGADFVTLAQNLRDAADELGGPQ